MFGGEESLLPGVWCPCRSGFRAVLMLNFYRRCLLALLYALKVECDCHLGSVTLRVRCNGVTLERMFALSSAFIVS